jgi:hypothetical protein
MKLSHSILSILAATCLVGCGGTNESGSGGNSALAPEQLPIQGKVQVGGLPLANTVVQLRIDGQVLATATSDQFGSFVFDTQPSGLQFSLPVATGSPKIDVTATIDGARYSSILEKGPEFVWVTELTTLVHDYLEAHPGTSFEDANTAVARSLGCPSGEEVEKLSDRDIFDPATFQKQADARGGDAALFAEVEAGLGTQIYNFAADDPYEALRLEGQDPHHRIEAVTLKAGEAARVYETLLGSLADDQKSPLGWVLARLAYNFDSRLGETVSQVLALLDSLNQLETELMPVLQRSQIFRDRNMSLILPVFNQYQAALASAVQSRTAALDTPDLHQPSLAALLQDPRFGSVKAKDYADRFLNYTSVRPGDDTVLFYHRDQMQSLGRSTPDPRLSLYDLRYNAVTDKLLNNLNYHLGVVQMALDMLANSAHIRPQLAQAIGDARLAALGGASSGFTSSYAAQYRILQQLVPPKLERDDIMVLPPTFPAVEPGTPTLLLRKLWTSYDLGGRPHIDFERWAFVHTSFLNESAGGPWKEVGLTLPGFPHGFYSDADKRRKWVLPDENQMRELDKIAAAAGQGDARLGLVRLGLYPADATVPIRFLFRNGYWRLSEPGSPGGSDAPLLNPRDGDYHYAALFVRSSVAGGTQEEYQSLLATGTEVKPRIDVSFGSNGRAVARATYNFPNGKTCTLDVTDRVLWRSDNVDCVEVSNLSGSDFPSGALLANGPGTANISASLLVDPTQPQLSDRFVTGTSQYTSRQGAQLRMRNISITPRNSVVTSAVDPVYFSCTAFLASTFPSKRPTHQAQDVTSHPSVDWTIRDHSGLVVPSDRATISSVFNGQSVVGGVLRILDPLVVGGEYTVEARLSGGDLVPAGTVLTDQTKVLINFPLP